MPIGKSAAWLPPQTGAPVFPYGLREHAEACAHGDWSSYTPQEIPLLDLVDEWLVGLQDDPAFVAAFRTPDSKGALVEAQQLASSLRSECELDE